MKRSTMRADVRARLGETSEDFWKDTDINRYLNDGVLEFCMAEKWPFMLTEGSSTIPAGDDTIDLTEGISWPRHMNVILTPVSTPSQPYAPKRVTPMEGFRLKTMFASQPSQTRPEYFYIASVTPDSDNSNQIGVVTYVARFIPTPVDDVDVDFQYYRLPETMDADTSEPDLPEEWHLAAVAWATAQCWWKELNGDGKAQEQMALYNDKLGQAKAEMSHQAPDDFLVMGREEPQYAYPRSAEEYARLRMAPTLG